MSGITREMTIDDIFKKHPHKSQKLATEMTNAGLHCASCAAATWETLEAGMLGHGKTEDEIEDLLSKLNKILEEEANPETITLTPRAANKFKEICTEDEKENLALRFGDKPAGCSGFEYVLDFSEKKEDTDVIFKSEGIEIHVHNAMVERLVGSVIDYVDGLQGAGFKISNPNAKSSCSCSSSHGY